MNTLIGLLYLASAALFFCGVLRFFRAAKKRLLTRRLFQLTLFSMAAVFLVLCALRLSTGQRIFPSSILIKTMKAFGMGLTDEYAALDAAVPILPWPVLNRALLIYLFVLYTALPVIGGAIIYDVLAGVSPTLRLFFSRRRHLYVFSELNEKSLALAESIAEAKGNAERLAIVFAGAAGGRDDPLALRTRALDAVCLPCALEESRGFRRAKTFRIFLIHDSSSDFDDRRNLDALHTLLDPEKAKSGSALWDPARGVSIFVFTNRAPVVESVRNIKERFDQAFPGTAEAAVRVNVVRDHAQACGQLMKTAPLFQPLGPYVQGEERPLRVAIFGTDDFAREMFRTVFWCGQMLDTQLYITVVGGNSRSVMEAWLNKLSPELLESCDWSGEPDCLRIWPDREDAALAPPYAGLSFVEIDARERNVGQLIHQELSYDYGCGEAYRLSDCDYFIVMAGSDEENAALAEDLRSALAFEARAGTSGAAKMRTIACAIEDDSFRTLLSERSTIQTDGDGLMFVPFGGLRKRFCWDTAALDEAYLALRGCAAYDDLDAHGFVDISQKDDSIYDTWARIGRDLHLRYKMYCAGCAAGGEPGAEAAYREKMAYFRRLREETEHPGLADRLAWMEHRRWTAFLRMQGFSRPFTDTGAMLRASEGMTAEKLRLYSFKNVAARLHPCLVESAPDGMHPLEAFPPKDLDMLDRISLLRGRASGKPADLKKYDYPQGEYLPYFDRNDVMRLLLGAVPEADPDRAWKNLIRKRDLSACASLRVPGMYRMDKLYETFPERF